MEEYDATELLAEEKPRNWDELIAHFKSIQGKIECAEQEISRLRAQVEFYRGRSEAFAEAMKFMTEGMNGRN